MKAPIKILHIDANYQVVYTIIWDGGTIRSSIPMNTALAMLEEETFDLVLSEPQSLAVLTSPRPSEALKSVLKFCTVGHTKNFVKQWLSANLQEMIDCPYQPGNLRSAKVAR